MYLIFCFLRVFFRSGTEGVRKGNVYLQPYTSVEDDRFRVSVLIQTSIEKQHHIVVYAHGTIMPIFNGDCKSAILLEDR